MKAYLAVLRKETDIRKLKEELEKKKIRLTAHYQTVGIVKLESEQAVSAEDFPEYFLSVEEERNNFKI